MAHAHCMLDTLGYKHTLRICTTYCYSTATMVARKYLSRYIYSVRLVNCGFTMSNAVEKENPNLVHLVHVADLLRKWSGEVSLQLIINYVLYSCTTSNYSPLFAYAV